MGDGPLLAFDTAAAHCAAAVVWGDRLWVRVDPMATGQAEHLIGMLEAMLAEAGLAWRDLAGIGVGTGPGNFTGIRISVSAARGLALGLGVPAIGVTGFEALAYQRPLPVWAVIPARRGMVHAARSGGAARLVPDDTAFDGAVVRQADLPAEDVIANVARIARAALGTVAPRPAPLYVRPPDAMPGVSPPPIVA